ncbi:hypothetical protein MMC29_007269, partial [Sticta canariensis]|nr:hypothetical protein [Sticta canariensis]
MDHPSAGFWRIYQFRPERNITWSGYPSRLDNHQISISPDVKLSFDFVDHGTHTPQEITAIDQHLGKLPNELALTPMEWALPADDLIGAVLANRRGAGEPVFEADFPPGSDPAGEIPRGPKAAERVEFELFTRLADFVQ